jgi:ABC-type dipeptide/oligopeptide/nickel transport system permease subunit
MVMGRCFNNLNSTLGVALSSYGGRHGPGQPVLDAIRAPTPWTFVTAWKPPSLEHPLGTDQYGRDQLSRVMTGAVNSIIVGLITVAIGMGAGIVLGLISAWGDRLG